MKKFITELPSFGTTAKWCLTLSWNASKFYTIIRIISDIATPLLAIALAFLGKHVLDLLATGGEATYTRHQLLLFFAGLTGIALLRVLSQRITQYSQTMHAELINKDISLSMMNRSLNADLEYFDDPAYYDRLQSASQDASAVSYILWNVISCISATVSFVGAFFVLFQANPLYGLLMVVAAIPSSIASAKYTKSLYMLTLDQINEQRQMSYIQHLTCEKAYAQDIRLFNAGTQLKERYRHIWQCLFTKRRNVTRRRSVLTGLLQILPEAIVVFIGIDIAFNVLNGANTVGDYALFTGLAGQLWSSLYMFSNSALYVYDNKLKIENIKKLDGFVNKVADKGTKSLSQIQSISFENISFTYPGALTPPVLDNVSFVINKKEKVVLVGINGSGKSTIIKLLLRMYEPNTGVIKINGRDIKEYQLAELRGCFSVYFQEMHNYNFNLRENFTIADKNGEDARILSALKAAHANDIISKTTQGLDTHITRQFDSAGIELSGGQHQKLALARALYRKHTALILDEPSSNLDPQAEHEIFNTLKLFTNNKMVLFTSHRLSNVALADRILVLEKGRLVEDGTHAELLENKHRYAELFQYQLDKYNQLT